MAYLMITQRCNMRCRHCGMSCTKKGEDMSLETFRNALDFFSGEMHTIGGGEPTLHPLFWQMLMETIAKSESVWMATNGKIKETALALASLAKKGVLGVALSQDPFHEEIDDAVVEAFTKDGEARYNRDNDYREIRNTSNHLIKTGRCKDGEEGCICEDIVVLPNGDVMGCGCKNARRLGNVNSEVVIPDDWEYGVCSKKQNEKIESKKE